MQDPSAPHEQEWRHALHSFDHVISLLASFETTTAEENEYKKLLSAILKDARGGLVSQKNQCRALESRIGLSTVEQHIKAARSFASRFEYKLVESGRCDQPHPESPASTWHLNDDDVAELASLGDDFYQGSIGVFWMRIEAAQKGWVSPRAPPHLYIAKLHTLRDRLFPPPELGPWINTNELRLWLDHCDNHHVQHCQFSPRSKEIFIHRPQWLIDVKRLCLVQSEARHRYVALSYVWGEGKAFLSLRQNIDRLQLEGSLRESSSQGSQDTALEDGCSDLPRTIGDAIDLTQQIGENFLWVDSLCIIQDNAEEKQEHLSHMGSIYANAYVTLVAAGGTAFSGLRGIEHATPPMERGRKTATYVQNTKSLQNQILLHHSKLSVSAWNHRAWTFQEQIFSRRLLIFGDRDVSWECHCTVWFERMDVVEGQCQDNRAVVAQGFSFGIEPNLWEYACHVQQYNGRKLSYPEDALDAFSGILNTLSTVFIGGFLCGLPRMYFDAALLWYNKTPLHRRRATRDNATPMPPTWAWAAWEGEILFRDHAKTPENVQSLVQWRIKAQYGNYWLPLRGREEREPDLEAESEVGVLISELSDLPEGEVTLSCSPMVIVSHLLAASPMRSFFRISEIYRDVQVLLAGAPGRPGGMLTSCETVNLDARGTLCEVVAISELSGDEDKDAVYNVIWIEWNDGIASRKGAGWVPKSTWVSSGAERIDLVLA